jgi:hypothetical protein
MSAPTPSTRGYLARIALAIGLFCLMNGLWTWPGFALYKKFPHSLAVYLGMGLVVLFLLWSAARDGRLSRRQAGLDVTGWTAPKRLLGLGLILLMGLGGYLSLQPPLATVEQASAAEHPAAADAASSDVAAAADVPPKPTWGDYSFWFVFLLSASLTELLVFVSIAFCFLERWLRQRGTSPIAAAVLAALFASVTFGLYHYTHPPRFWDFVYFPLMPVMLINTAYFAVTRNFWLTLLLHNAFATVGFTQEQWAETIKQARGLEFDAGMFPATYLQSGDTALLSIVGSFVVCFAALHWIEARSFRDIDAAGGQG